MRKKKQVIVQTRNLTKKYGDFTAVDDLNLMIEQGEIFGLLGPNGSGKTSLLMTIMGYPQYTVTGYEFLEYSSVLLRLIHNPVCLY